MQLYPAIDLKGGKCVRLRQGSFNDVKCYSDSPAETAREWERRGASFLHVVDLDGALEGRSVNFPVIEEIRAAVKIPIEIGGGIRSAEAAENLLSAGIHRVIVGTKAVRDPSFMGDLVKRFGADAVAAGVDARDGIAAVEGWEASSGLKASDLCLTMKAQGVRHIIYTDISRDGMLTGPNVKATAELVRLTGLDVIASGGVSGMRDLESLSEAGIPGCIIGKALYENRIDLTQAVWRFEGRGDVSRYPWESLKKDPQGLLPVIVQDCENGDVLMCAWMNGDAYRATVETGRMTYWSRSRQELWRKGDTSGHVQYVRSLTLDCDLDTMLARVYQVGAACHTGSRSCFFNGIRTLEERN